MSNKPSAIIAYIIWSVLIALFCICLYATWQGKPLSVRWVHSDGEQTLSYTDGYFTGFQEGYDAGIRDGYDATAQTEYLQKRWSRMSDQEVCMKIWKERGT